MKKACVVFFGICFLPIVSFGMEQVCSDQAQDTPQLEEGRGREDVNTLLFGGQETALHAMASCGNVQFVRYLIDHGAHVNALDSSGATPLHRAAKSCRLSVVFEMLLAAGAQVNARDRNGWTPLHVAAAYNRVGAVSLLLKVGAQQDARDSHGMTPLDVAVRGARELLEKSKDS